MKRIGIKRLLVVSACIAAGGVLAADKITWDEPRNIAGDADVVTAGRLCYAYTKADNAVTVNGVPFARAYNSNINNYPLNDPYWELSENNQELNGYIGGDYFYPAATQRPATISDDYRKLLGLWVYGSGATTIKLRNFVVGHTYLVQIWVNNARADNASLVNSHYVTLDGDVSLCLHPTGAPAGQYAIGRFTATENEATIDFTKTELVGCSGDYGYNAIQVRDITPGTISWSAPVTSYDDSDVRTNGELVIAFNGSNKSQTYTVNGVPFKAAGSDAINFKQVVGIQSIPSGCGFSAYDPPSTERANYNATYPETASADYKSMLGTFMYVSGASSSSAMGHFWFTGLVVGERYLVQLWFNKSQKADADRYLKVDQVRNVDGRVGTADNRGQYIVGEFTAYATAQEFYLRGASHAQSTTDGVNVTFSAIQLRHLPPVGKTAFTSGWTGVTFAQGATDVSTEGTLVGAYFANKTAQKTLTVNGVPFVSQQSLTSWGDGKVLLRGFPHCLAEGLMKHYTGSDLGDYKTLLDTSVMSFYYSDRDPDFKNKNPVNAELTFTGLEPNTRYEVQAWVNDNTPPEYKSGSGGYGGDWRLATFGNLGPYPYRSPDEPHLGPIGRARIIVSGETTSVKLPISYTTHSDIPVNEVRAYLNAVQIRKADTLVDPADPDASKILAWTGYGAPWNTSEGTDRMALLANGGTMDLTDKAYVGSVQSFGDLTISGSGTLALADEIIAPSCTVSAPLAGTTLVKMHDGLLTIAGAAPDVSLFLLRAGTLDFSPTVAPTEGVFISARTGAAFAFGADLKVARWDIPSSWTMTRKGNATLKVNAGENLAGLTIAIPELAAGYRQHPVLFVEGGSLKTEPTFVAPEGYVAVKRTDVAGNDAYYLKKDSGLVIFVK